MFDITPENLKWAYKKLKTHYYYNKSSLFLKKKILLFEKKIKNRETSFEKIAKLLKEYATYPTDEFVEGFYLYPKKNTFKKDYDKVEVDPNCLNYFIDLNIEFHLVDVLFTLNLLNEGDRFVCEKGAYAGKKDKRIKKNSMKNALLFSGYYSNYQRWKNIPTRLTSKNRATDITVVRMDLKRCFYSCWFNFDNLVNTIFSKKAMVNTIMKKIFVSYTRKLSQTIDSKPSDLKRGDVILPVGLLSSSALLNILFGEFDFSMLNNGNVAAYGRYADDIIIVLKKYYKTTLDELLQTAFPKYFLSQKNEIVLKPNSFLKGNLVVNKEKCFVRRIYKDQQLSKDDEISDSIEPSFIGYFDDEEDYLDVILEETKDLSNYRESIRKISKENAEQAKSASKVYSVVEQMDNSEILNTYPLWLDTFKLLKSSDYYQRTFTRFSKIVDTIEKKDYLSQQLYFTLKNELEFAYYLSQCSAKECCYLANITQQDTNLYLDSFFNGNEKAEEFFPAIITPVDASYYLQSQYISDGCYPLFREVAELCKKANRVDGGYVRKLLKLKYDYSNTDKTGTIDIETGNKGDKKIRIALAALNIHDLAKSNNINDEKPKYYNLYTIERMIIEANKYGAKYFLLPEFSIEYDWIIPLAKTARSYDITLIAGVIHQPLFNPTVTQVVNLTMLFESHSKTILLKPKNYMPPSEQHLIEDVYGYSKCYVPAKPYYYILNDGIFKYSFMTCYEITNIQDRCRLADKINMLFIPVYNRDTTYFSSIINSYARDISCFIAQANSNSMGDTCIRQPTSDLVADVVKIKGGINNYFVIGELDLTKLKKENKKYLRNRKKYFLDNKSKSEKKRHLFKPLSAGDHHCK